MTAQNKKHPKVTIRKMKEKIQEGICNNGWALIGVGGTQAEMMKPLVEYLRKSGIEVK